MLCIAHQDRRHERTREHQSPVSIRRILLLVAFVVAALLRFVAGMPFGFALLIPFVAWPVLGTLVTIDDDLAGGWSNPDGSVIPPWRQAPYWGQLCGGLALSAIGFAMDVRASARAAAFIGAVALALAVLSARLLGLRRHDRQLASPGA